MIAMGINRDGQREILAIELMLEELEEAFRRSRRHPVSEPRFFRQQGKGLKHGKSEFAVVGFKRNCEQLLTWPFIVEVKVKY